jgi:hypothetical protein
LINARASGRRKHAGLRVSGLRLRRHGADLDRAESHRRQAVDAAAILVEPGGEPDSIRKGQSGEAHRVDDAALLNRADQRRALDPRQRREGQVVRLLGIEAEQERAGEGVRDQGHGTFDVAPLSRTAYCLHDRTWGPP